MHDDPTITTYMTTELLRRVPSVLKTLVYECMDGSPLNRPAFSRFLPPELVVPGPLRDRDITSKCNSSPPTLRVVSRLRQLIDTFTDLGDRVVFRTVNVPRLKHFLSLSSPRPAAVMPCSPGSSSLTLSSLSLTRSRTLDRVATDVARKFASWACLEIIDYERQHDGPSLSMLPPKELRWSVVSAPASASPSLYFPSTRTH